MRPGACKQPEQTRGCMSPPSSTPSDAHDTHYSTSPCGGTLPSLNSSPSSNIKVDYKTKTTSFATTPPQGSGQAEQRHTGLPTSKRITSNNQLLESTVVGDALGLMVLQWRAIIHAARQNNGGASVTAAEVGQGVAPVFQHDD